MKIKCMIDETKYNNKPQGKEIGMIQNNMKPIEIIIEELAQILVVGSSFRPSFLNGKKEVGWQSQQIFALDFDDGTTIEEELDRCRKLEILPIFAYTSFSHTEDHHKFRLVFLMDEVINDYTTANKVQSILMSLFSRCDERCSNLSRLYFGGRKLIYENYNSVINHNELLAKYSHDSNLGLIDYDKRYYNNTYYHSRKTPLTTVSSANYNIQAIKDGNVQYLHSVLDIKDEVIISNEQDFYDYVRTRIDLSKLLGVDNPHKFKCIVHNDNNPSAGIINADDGAYIYNCFGCGFSGNIIQVIQALTKMKTHKVIEYIKKIYNIQILKTDWQQEQINVLETNKQMLISGYFESCYPEVYKIVKRYVPQLIMMHDIAIMNVRDENYTDDDGNIVFFISNRNLTDLLNSKSNKRINQRNVLFAFLQLLKKLDKEEIPEEDLKKALEIQEKYNHHRIVNYFSIGDYDIFKMVESEKRALMWNENNMSMTGLSYEGVYRTFGHEMAWEIYPQYRNTFIKADEGYKEVNRTTSQASNQRTNEITIIIMNRISENGYVVEKDIIEELRGKYGKTFIQTQIKRSLNEILDGYDLKRVRANKILKQQYGVVENGYPFLILKNN